MIEEWISVNSESEVTQSCPTLCDPMDCSLSGSSVFGILQARTLEWVAISFSNACKWKVKAKSLSPVRLFATPWTAAYQAPLSMEFPRQKYQSGLPFPSPEDLPNPGIVPMFLVSPTLAGRFFNCTTWEPQEGVQDQDHYRSVMSDSLQPHGL